VAVRKIMLCVCTVLSLCAKIFRFLTLIVSFFTDVTFADIHNEELYDLYSSPNIFRVIKSRRMKSAGHVARLRDRKGADRVLVRTPGGRISLGMPRSRWKDRVIIDLREVEWGGIDWFDLAED